MGPWMQEGNDGEGHVPPPHPEAGGLGSVPHPTPPTDLLQPLHEPSGHCRREVKQQSLLLQLSQRGREPAGWAQSVGETTLPDPSLKSIGVLRPPVEAQPSETPSGPHPRPCPDYSLVVTDTDDRSHQDTPLWPQPPPLTGQHGQAPWLRLLRALALNDAEQHIDGSLGEGAEDVMSHSPHCPPTHPPVRHPGPPWRPHRSRQ